jgi:uncharacterized membrane protein/uncharacterized protein YjbJ (UPF0337 family)
MNAMNIIVVVFDSEQQAHEGVQSLRRLDAEGEITLYTHVMLVRDAGGKLTVKQESDRLPLGTVAGAFVGSLLGMLGGPGGVIVGTGVGMLGGTLHDLSRFGNDEEFLAEVERRLQAGRTAVVAEVCEDSELPIDARMKTLYGLVFRVPRREIEMAHIEKEVAEGKAQLAELKAEYARANKEARALIQAKTAGVRTNLQATEAHSRAAVESAKQERDARIQVLEAQAARAQDEVRGRIEARLAEVRSAYQQRIDRLNRNREHIREVQATCDEASQEVAADQRSAAQESLAGHKQRFEGRLKVAAGEIEEAFGRVIGQPDIEAAGLRKQAEGKEEEASGEALLHAPKKADGKAF